MPTIGELVRERIESSRKTRLAILLAGILVCQFILYGPCLIGAKVLLPIDTLAQPNVYIPVGPETAGVVAHDAVQSELAYVTEPERQFVVSELWAGRWPQWNPAQYAGKPVTQGPWLDPLSILLAAIASPIVLAWHQLLAAMIAAVGFYLFCRRVLMVSYWSSLTVAWCYPMTGFFVFWLGFPTCAPVYWLPWLLLAVDGAIFKATLNQLAAVALAVSAVLSTSQLGVAFQVLGVGALYALWRIAGRLWGTGMTRAALRAWGVPLLGVCLGLSLSAPHWLPIVAYARTGAVLEKRAAGNEDSPPGSLSAIQLLVLPDATGATRDGSHPLPGNYQIESAAGAYSGLLVALFLAPLAWRRRQDRSFAIFFTVLLYLALAWCVDIQGIVSVLRLPGLNLLRQQRLVFAANLSLLALAAIGLDALGEPMAGARRKWLLLPAGLATGLASWWLYRSVDLPEPIATEIGRAFSQGEERRWMRAPEDIERIQAWFRRAYSIGSVLSLNVAMSWLLLSFAKGWHGLLRSTVIAILLFDLIWFAHDRSAQCSPSLYYPKVAVLEALRARPTERIVGYNNLPAALAQASGLRDVRGYDGVDPSHYLRLLDIAAGRETLKLSYAESQWFSPKVTLGLPSSLILSPVLDLLGVRYVVFRGSPPAGFVAELVGQDYWVARNPSALPRAFVAQNIEIVPEPEQRLERMARAQFDPVHIAYVESPVNVPAGAFGRAVITNDEPTKVTVAVDMDTSGLVVLADRWDSGWSAYLNGQKVPILRVDHALRGVIVPEGRGTLEFRYQPLTFRIGALLFALGLALLAGALVVQRRHRRAVGPG